VPHSVGIGCCNGACTVVLLPCGIGLDVVYGGAGGDHLAASTAGEGGVAPVMQQSQLQLVHSSSIVVIAFLPRTLSLSLSFSLSLSCQRWGLANVVSNAPTCNSSNEDSIVLYTHLVERYKYQLLSH